MKRSWVLASLLASALCVVTNAASGDLITNGDFALGNIGFGSDYALATPGTPGNGTTTSKSNKAGWSKWKNSASNGKSDPDEGKYLVTTTPNAWNPNFVTPYSAELPLGNTMLVVNGADNISSRVWYQDILVVADTIYDVSFSAASLFPDNPALLRFFAGVDPNDTAAIHEVASIELTGATGVDAWLTATGQFTARGTGSVRLFIVDLVTAACGNDFALDNISVLQAIPEPSSLALLGLGSLIAAALHTRRRTAKKRTR